MGGRIAQRFAEAGADVVSPLPSQALKARKKRGPKTICSAGRQALVLQADLSQAVQVGTIHPANFQTLRPTRYYWSTTPASTRLRRWSI
jgi:NAD(P)-dependent dehydrogenase (short-subunit alcohol dehydrogenase family)